MNKKLIVAVAVLIVLIFSGCQVTNEEENSQTEEQEVLPQVEVKTLQTNDSTLVSLNKLGKVQANEKTTVISEISGRITSLNAKLGQEVKEGETLAQLGNSLSTELLAINKQLAEKDKQLAQGILSATYESTQKELEVMQKSVDNAFIAYQNSLTLQTNTSTTLQKQIELAALAISQAKAAHQTQAAVLSQTAQASYVSNDNIYNSLAQQSKAALAQVEISLDVADLVLAQKNSKYNALRGFIKRNSDYSSYVMTEYNFKKALDEITDAKDTLEKAEASGDPNALQNAANQILQLVDKTEQVLIDEDDYLQDTRVPASLDLGEPISLFNAKYPQAIATLGSNRSGIQQTLNSLNSNFQNNQLQITSLKGQTVQGGLQIKNAEKNYEQTKSNAQTQLDNLQFQVETARNQYESAQAQLNSLMAKAEIQKLQAANSVNQANKQATTTAAQLEASNVKAPISGSITSINIEEGDFTQQGQALITIESTDSLKIEANVTEEDLTQIQIGSKVEIENSKGQKSVGVVSAVGESIDQQSKLFPIEIAIINNNGLRAGTFVRLNFTEDEETKNFFVPLKSIFFTKTSRTVYTINENNEIEVREVKLRKITGENVEIVEGLKEGDKVMIEGGRQLNAGDKVEINS